MCQNMSMFSGSPQIHSKVHQHAAHPANTLLFQQTTSSAIEAYVEVHGVAVKEMHFTHI